MVAVAIRCIVFPFQSNDKSIIFLKEKHTCDQDETAGKGSFGEVGLCLEVNETIEVENECGYSPVNATHLK